MSSKSISPCIPLHSMQFLCRVLPFFTSSRFTVLSANYTENFIEQRTTLTLCYTNLMWFSLFRETLIRELLIDFYLIYLILFARLFKPYVFDTNFKLITSKKQQPVYKILYCENCGFLSVGGGMTNKHCTELGEESRLLNWKGNPVLSRKTNRKFHLYCEKCYFIRTSVSIHFLDRS